MKSWSENNREQERTFGAEQLLKLTSEEEIIQKKKQYQSLRKVNGEQLPDLFTELEDD